MRLRQRDLKTYTVKSRVTIKEPDATTSEGWGDPTTIQANIQPAGGKLMAEMYGERLAYMLVGYVEKGTAIKETDGVCVYVAPDADPDYKVVAVAPWNSHLVVSLEVIR